MVPIIYKDPADAIAFEKYLLEVRKLGVRSIKIYMFYYRHLDLDKLSEEYIDKFIRKHGNIAPVRGFMKNYLEYHGLNMEKIKFPKMPTGRKPKRIVRPITKEEIVAERDYLYKVSFKKGLMFEIMYQGALRRVEVPTIRLNSFQWNVWFEDPSKFCRLKVLGKGKKERFVIINPKTIEKMLSYYLENFNFVNNEHLRNYLNSDKLLFKRKDGRSINEKIVYDIIKKASLKIFERDIRPHEMRHQRASELEESGVSVRDIQKYLGHSRITTTEGYLHGSSGNSLKKIENKIS